MAFEYADRIAGIYSGRVGLNGCFFTKHGQESNNAIELNVYGL